MNPLSLSNTLFRSTVTRPDTNIPATDRIQTCRCDVDVVREGIRSTYYMHMMEKLRSISLPCLPFQCEAPQSTSAGTFTVTYDVGAFTLRQEVDRLQADRRHLHDTDIKAIFGMILHVYTIYDECLEFDMPSMDSLYVLDGRLMFACPYSAVQHAKIVNDVCDLIDARRSCL